MAKTKNTNVSASILMRLVIPETKTINYEGIDIVITPTLSLGQAMQFIDNIVNSCIDEETGEYTPITKELAIAINTIIMYSNCEVPSDNSDRYNLVYQTELYQTIVDNINSVQFYNLLDVIDSTISHKLAITTSTATQQVNILLAKIDEMNSRMNEAFGEFMGVDMAEVLKGLLINGSVDEEKLVNAVLKSKDDIVTIPKNRS